MKRIFLVGYGSFLLYAGMPLLTIAGSRSRSMDPEQLDEVKSAVRWYHYYYIALMLERWLPSSDFARLFTGDNVRMADDFGYGAGPFSGPVAYYDAAKPFLVSARPAKNCEISLSDADDFRYAQDGEDILVYLYKDITYKGAGGQWREYASWERLRMREIGREWKIAEVVQVEQPGGEDEAGAVKKGEAVTEPVSVRPQTSYRPRVTYQPAPVYYRPVHPPQAGTWVYYVYSRRWVFYPAVTRVVTRRVWGR